MIHIRKKWACKACEETITTAKLPKQPFPKSIATAGLVAAVIDAKFNRHLPLYRQEDMFKSMGADISRTNLGNWVVKAASLLKPIVDAMVTQINSYDVAYADETVLQVLNEQGKLSTNTSYMWLFGGGPPDKRCFVYQYHPSRQDAIAKQFFDTFEQIKQVRMTKALPILTQFKEWLLTQQKKTLPKSPLGKALFYSIKHWDSLI